MQEENKVTHHGHHVVHHKLNAIKAIKKGWQLTMENPVKYFFVSLGIWALMISISIIAFIGYFLNMAVVLYTIKLLLSIYEKDSRKNSIDFNKYLMFLGTNLLVGLIVMIPIFIVVSIWGLIAFIGQAKGIDTSISVTEAIPILIGVSICLFISLYFITRLFFAKYIVADKDINPIQAIKRSWQMTKGNIVEIIYLILMGGGVLILGFVAIFFGAFLAFPVIYFAYVDAYKQMIGEAKH